MWIIQQQAHRQQWQRAPTGMTCTNTLPTNSKENLEPGRTTNCDRNELTGASTNKKLP